ncbi:MAG: DsrH/TusB family sulfur metabolism protein [Rheinheimera sp.]
MILYQCSDTCPHLQSLITSADALLFRQDGVYLLLTNTQWPTSNLYALQQDVSDRNLQCPASVKLINDSEWVELCATAKQVVLC